MIAAAALALSEIFSRPFRAVMWKSLVLTIGLLLASWIALQALFAWVIDMASYPCLETIINIVFGFGLLFGLAFLIAPIASIFAGIFTDDIAALVERTRYPSDPTGQSVPLSESIRDAITLTALVILVNLVALALLLVPGVNVVAFLVGNGYLLGREFFEAAARRFHGREEARALRRANAGRIFVAGILIALFLAVPLLNLFTPLFATAFMVHVYKRLSRGPTRVMS